MIFIFLVYVLAHHVTNNLGCYNKYRKNADILPEKDIGPREGMKIERKKKERKIIWDREKEKREICQKTGVCERQQTITCPIIHCTQHASIQNNFVKQSPVNARTGALFVREESRSLSGTRSVSRASGGVGRGVSSMAGYLLPLPTASPAPQQTSTLQMSQGRTHARTHTRTHVWLNRLSDLSG